MANAFQALEHQWDIAAWGRTRYALSMMQFIDRDMAGPDDVALGIPDRGSWQRAQFMANELAGSMEEATTYYVTPDMAAVIHDAAMQLEEQGVCPRLEPEDILTEYGFVYVPENLTGRNTVPGDDPVDQTMADTVGFPINIDGGSVFKYEAFSWMLYDGIVTRAADNTTKQNPGITVFSYADKEVIGFNVGNPAAPPLCPFDITGWAFETEWTDSGEYKINAEPGVNDASSAWHRRWMYAFFQVIQERVDVQEPTRNERRRMERKNHNPENKIRVITLRRASYPQKSDGSGIDWDHRWLVRGHWRNQWFPGSQTHKMIWIDGYVKGPEDKELVTKHTIYKVSR